MPSCMWWNVITISASSSTVFTGCPAQVATASCGAPTSRSMLKMNHSVSGTSAIAVTRSAYQ